jgi:hypothetical protein
MRANGSVKIRLQRTFTKTNHVLMEQQPTMMEKKGKMEMPMTGGLSLGLLLLPTAALLVGMSLMAGYVVRRRG